jgi:hypothetical protein
MEVLCGLAKLLNGWHNWRPDGAIRRKWSIIGDRAGAIRRKWRILDRKEGEWSDLIFEGSRW